MNVIKCDFCKSEIFSSKYIELGSNNESLCYKNPIENDSDNTYNMLEIGNHSNLHFCSKDHFINFFFKPKKQ